MDISRQGKTYLEAYLYPVLSPVYARQKGTSRLEFSTRELHQPQYSLSLRTVGLSIAHYFLPLIEKYGILWVTSTPTEPRGKAERGKTKPSTPYMFHHSLSRLLNGFAV